MVQHADRASAEFPMRRPLAPLIALAALTALAGCSKDAPEAPPAPPSAEAPAAQETQEADPAQDDRAAAEPAAEAAPPKGPAPRAAPATSPPPSAMQMISLPTFAPGIVAVLSSPSLSRLVRSAVQVAESLGAHASIPPDPLEAVLEAVRIQVGIANLDWLDARRAIHVAIPDPKRFVDGFCVLVPIAAEPEAVVEALGERLEAHEGRAGVVTLGERRVLIDFIEGHLVATSHPELLALLRPFLTETLLGWEPPHPLVLEVDAQNLRAAFADELDAVRSLAEDLARQMGDEGSPAQAEVVADAVASLHDFTAHAERFAVALDLSDRSARLAFGLRGAAGSTMAATIEQLGERQAGLQRAVPAGAWLSVVSHLAPELMTTERDEVLASIAQLGLAPHLAERVADHVVAIGAAGAGDALFSLGDEGFPFALTAASHYADGHAARRGVLGVLGAMFEHGLTLGRSELGAGHPAVDAAPSDLRELVALANQIGGAMGIRLEVVDEERGGVHVHALVTRVDWDRTGLARLDPAGVRAARTLLGDEIAMVLAGTSERLAVAIGPRGLAHATALAKGEALGGEPVLQRISVGAFAAATLRLGAMLQTLAELPGAHPFPREAVANLPSAEAFGLVGRSDAGTLVIEAHLSLELLVALMNAGL